MPPIDDGTLQTAFRLRDHSGATWGTGFGYFRPDDYNAWDPQVHTNMGEFKAWLVTCAHVIDVIEASQVGSQQVIHLEINRVSGDGGIVALSIPIATHWTRHSDWVERCRSLGPIEQRNYTPQDAAVDVAVVPFPLSDWTSELEGTGFAPEEHLTKPRLSSGQLAYEGTEVFVIGFPTGGYYEEVKNWPVVRQGVLAQFKPFLYGEAKTFLIDGSIFGGNSGDYPSR